jgi:hypothetical protein
MVVDGLPWGGGGGEGNGRGRGRGEGCKGTRVGRSLPQPSHNLALSGRAQSRRQSSKGCAHWRCCQQAQRYRHTTR